MSKGNTTMKRIVAFLLALILAVPSGIGDIAGFVYAATGNSAETQNNEPVDPEDIVLNIEWCNSPFKNGTSFSLYEAADSSNIVKTRINYSCKSVREEGYEAGELIITVKGIGNVNRNGILEAVVGADKEGAGAKRHEWSYTWNKANDTYTFVNNEAIEGYSVFSGYFELAWEVSARESVHGYQQDDVEAMLYLPDGENVQSQALSFINKTKGDAFGVKIELGGMSSYEGLTNGINNPDDYVFIRYNLGSKTTKNSRGLRSSSHVFNPDVTGVGNGAIVISPRLACNSLGNGLYAVDVETYLKDFSMDKQYLFVAYPKESYEGKTVKASVELRGVYYEGDDSGNTSEQVVAKDVIEHVIPLDFSFGNPVGDIYDFWKDTWYDKYVNDEVTAEKGGDVNGADIVSGTKQTFYLEGALNNPKGYAYTLEIVDDFLYILKNNGQYRELGKDEYEFESVTIPGTEDLKNSNGYSIMSNAYTFKVYVAYGGALINTDASAEPYATGKLVAASREIKLPAGVTAVAIVFEDVKESISYFSIPVVVDFHIQDTSRLEALEQDNLKTGQIVNTAFIKLYEGGTWENDFFDASHYNDNTNLGLAEKDKTLYGNGQYYLDREKDSISLYEGDKNDYYVSVRIDELEKTGNKFFTNVYISAFFDFVDAKYPNKFSLYAILPEDLALNGYRVEEDIWDIMMLKGLDMSAEELAEACTAEIITNYKGSKRTYIALHFDFGDKAVKQDGVITATFKVKANEYEKFAVYGAVMIDDSISQYSWYKNEDNGDWGDNKDLFVDIDGDGDTTEVLSGDVEYFSPDAIADSAQFLIAKYVQTSYSDGWTLFPDVPYAEFGSDYQYKLSVKNGSSASSNIVIMDVLESEEGGQWQGTLQGVDLSACEALGLSATVYYSTDANPGALNSGKWTTTKPGNVKAVAVDFGNSVLGEGQELSIILNMKAPNDATLKDKVTGNAFSASITMNETKHDKLDSNSVQVKLTPPLKSIIVTKIDAESGAKLPGAIFSLIAKATGKVVATVETNGKGYAIFHDVPADGNYIIRETKAPYGYETADDTEVVVAGADVRVTIANKRKVGKIEIYKVNGFDKNVKVEGATYTLFDANGNVVETAITNANGLAVFEGVVWGKYIVKETATPDGYQLNETAFPVEINRENAAETYIIDTVNQQEDVKVHLDKFITTVNGDKTTKPLAGVTFELVRITGNGDWRVGLYVTDKNGHIDIIELPYGKYYFREYRVPVGYVGVENVHFELNPNQKEINLTVYNKQKAGSVIILKSDNLGNMVKGAEFTLYDSTKDNVLTVGKTDEAGVLRFDDLAWGTYYVKETAAPNGYVMNEEWKEVVIGATSLEVEVKCINETKKGSVVLTKTSEADSNVLLPGAVYTLYTANNSVFGTYTTDANGQIVVEGLEWGGYYFKEVEAPAGYGLSDDLIRFSVNAANAGIQQQLSAIDPKDARHITLTKRVKASEINFANGNPTFIFKVEGVDIEGKSHTYYRMVTFDKAYVTANTGNDGYVAQSVKIAGLTAGTYTATEMEVSRYCLDGIYESTNGMVSNDGNSVSFDLDSNKEAAATFTNWNYEQQDYSDNQNLTNIIKKKAKLTAIKVAYGTDAVQAQSNVDMDMLSVVVYYDDGVSKELTTTEKDKCVLDVQTFSDVNGDYTVTVTYEENGITRSGTFSVTVCGGVERIVRLEATLLYEDSPVRPGSVLYPDMFVVTAIYVNGDTKVLSPVPTSEIKPYEGEIAVTETVGLTAITGDVLTITSPGWAEGTNYPADMTNQEYHSMFNCPGADGFLVTFDPATEMDEGYDFVRIFDGVTGDSIYKLSERIAGKQYVVPGESLMVSMTSDDVYEFAGFSATFEPIRIIEKGAEYTISPDVAPDTDGEFDVTINLNLDEIPNGGNRVSTEVKMEAEYPEPLLATWFTNYIGSATEIVFTTDKAPDNTTVDDLSENYDNSVVGWLEGTTYYISSQRGGVPVIATSCNGMFKNRKLLEKVDLQMLDTSRVDSMYQMFYGCSKLTEVNLAGIDVSSVTTMNWMFGQCRVLTKVNFTGLNTENLIDMGYMFGYCAFTELDMSCFNTTNVQNFEGTFYICTKLASLNLDGWVTSSAVNMKSMFDRCSSLTFDCSGWDVTKVTNYTDFNLRADGVTAPNWVN